MLETILARIFTSQWMVIGTTSVLLLLAAELGFRLGLRLHREKDEARKGQIGGIQAAMLGLLGLLLGFTFAMAVGRYETRRDLVLREANSIGTTYLRTSLLPDDCQAGSRDLLRRYVDVRLDFYSAGENPEREAASEREAAAIQHELWSQAVAAAKGAPTPLSVSYIGTLNETIDLDAARLNAMRAHVPGAVWLLVLAVALCGCCGSGYGTGSTGARSAFANIVLPLLIAVAITLIADLDRPRGGLIGISQQPLLDLKASLSAPK